MIEFVDYALIYFEAINPARRICFFQKQVDSNGAFLGCAAPLSAFYK
jgi:hypothetical protein